jgi:translocator protein
LTLTPRSVFTRRYDWASLALLLALSAIVAGVSGAATVRNVGDWYAALNKPSFNPPNPIFGPVWTVLYIAMAVAAWRVWRGRDEASVAIPVRLYLAQMAFNFAWSILFFGMHKIALALVDILILLGLLAATTVAFWKCDKPAGALMVPCLAWVGFASALNFAIKRLLLAARETPRPKPATPVPAAHYLSPHANLGSTRPATPATTIVGPPPVIRSECGMSLLRRRNPAVTSGDTHAASQRRHCRRRRRREVQSLSKHW